MPYPVVIQFEALRAERDAQLTRIAELRNRLLAAEVARSSGVTHKRQPLAVPTKARPERNPKEKGDTMLHKISRATIAFALVGILAVSFARAGSATPKPGFLPGTWVGKGVIKGYAVDGPMATHFDGGIAFTLKVSTKLRVTGAGTWRMNMLGSEDAPSSFAVDSTMIGTAAIRLGGTSTAPTFAGTQKVTGEIRSGSMKQPISMERPLNGKLTIGRAGKCRVRGVTVVQPGVTLAWSAQLKGSGKCNA